MWSAEKGPCVGVTSEVPSSQVPPSSPAAARSAWAGEARGGGGAGVEGELEVDYGAAELWELEGEPGCPWFLLPEEGRAG